MEFGKTFGSLGYMCSSESAMILDEAYFVQVLHSVFYLCSFSILFIRWVWIFKMCLSIGVFFSVSHHNFDFLFISPKPSLLFQKFYLATPLYHIRPLDIQTTLSTPSSQPPFTSCPALPPPAHPPSPVSAPSSPQVGDQILEVNGRSFLSIPHDEAVRVLKSSHHLMMTVKDVGRLPHARTVVGETKWITSSQITDSSASSSVTGWVTRWWKCEETRKVREIDESRA